jgi:hypothetical protein
MNMTFEMPVMLCGAMSFLPDGGSRINQIYCLNQDPTNAMYKGMVPAKMSCDEIVFQSLSMNNEDFPMQVTLVVSNKTVGGKTVQHAQSVKLPPVGSSTQPKPTK